MEVPPLTPLASAVLHVPMPERALVLSCGAGEAVLLLAREFPAARVRGADSSPDLIHRASERVGLDPEGRVAFKVGGARAIPYPDRLFDLVVQVGGRSAPGETARVLRPGGHLIVARERSPRVLPGVRERVLRAGLGRHGFSIQRSESAGAGNFLVARLDGPHRAEADI